MLYHTYSHIIGPIQQVIILMLSAQMIDECAVILLVFHFPKSSHSVALGNIIKQSQHNSFQTET